MEEAARKSAEGDSDAVRHARELEVVLQQRTALLHEVDHRVKNNLQMICSLLLLQSRRSESPEARAALQCVLERVNAVATVHRRLFKSDDLEHFDVSEFVRDLASDLGQSLGRAGISVKLDLEPVAVPANQAAALALVVNELVGNALKHAFPDGRPGEVVVTIRRQGDGFEIAVADDGIGALEAPGGFGATIIQLLSRQLRANYEAVDAQPGRRAVVKVPLEPARI